MLASSSTVRRSDGIRNSPLSVRSAQSIATRPPGGVMTLSIPQSASSFPPVLVTVRYPIPAAADAIASDAVNTGTARN